jgi:hypothetical protein
MKVARSLLLLAVPLIIFALARVTLNAQGPFYLGWNSDPEYCYLLNSINILQGKTPGHTDHPGTTLQEFGAGVVAADWMLRAAAGNRESLEQSVLLHPESYLRHMNDALVALIGAALFWAALSILQSTGSLTAALITQASVFLFPNLILSLGRVSPEPLLFAVGFILLGLLAPVVFQRRDDRAVLAGVIVGFGLVTKVTFFPWILVGALFRGRRLIHFAIAFVLACFVLMLPIVSVLPRVAGWLFSIAIHSGHYGSGSVGLPAASEWLDHAKQFVYWHPVMPLLGGFYAAVLLGFVRARQTRTWAILAISLLAIGLQIVVTLKHFASHYTLPAMVLACGLNGFLFVSLRNLKMPRKKLYLIALAAAAIFAVGLIGSRIPVRNSLQSARDRGAEAQRLEQQRASHTQCVVIGYYRSSVPSFALNFGSEYSAWVHGSLLTKLYSDQVSYNRFGGGFWSYSRDPRLAKVRQMIEAGQCVWMEGSRATPTELDLPAELTLEPVHVEESEAIYRLTARAAR